MKKRSLMVAYAPDNSVMGINGQLPWRLPKDTRFFKNVTMSAGICIMGRKNYESLPNGYRPLLGRKNIILTRNPLWTPEEEDDSIIVVNSFWEALEEAEKAPGEEICFIGGAEIYKLALENIILHKIHRTLVFTPNKINGDVFFPTNSLPSLRSEYEKTYEEMVLRDQKHCYSFSMETWQRV